MLDLATVPNTSVHFPAVVLAGLDRVAADQGISRNRLIVEACRRTLEEALPPEDFFTDAHLSAADLRLLRQSRGELDRAIESSRRSRTRPPF